MIKKSGRRLSLLSLVIYTDGIKIIKCLSQILSF